MTEVLTAPSRGPASRDERHLRVAMVLQAFAPVLGGAQRQVEQLGPHLAAHGIEATVLTRRPAGAPAREQRPGLDVRRLSGGWGGARASVAFTSRAAAALVRLDPDVVHVHDLLSPATAALLAGARREVPVVAKVASTGPGGDVDRLLAKPFGRLRLRGMAARFSAFLCLTRDVEDDLLAHGVPSHRLRRLVNGVDVDHHRPPLPGEARTLRRRLGLRLDVPLVLYAGRLAAVKRLDVVLEAFARATTTGHLVLLGEGPERERLRRRSHALGVAERVHLEAVVDDTAPYLRAADVYVSASGTEGMSNSVLEALATGIPVAAAPASGMDELLADGGGLLASDPGPDALARVLGTLLDDPVLCRRCGAAARRTATCRYALDGVAATLTDLYGELAAVPAGRV